MRPVPDPPVQLSGPRVTQPQPLDPEAVVEAARAIRSFILELARSWRRASDAAESTFVEIGFARCLEHERLANPDARCSMTIGAINTKPCRLVPLGYQAGPAATAPTVRTEKPELDVWIANVALAMCHARQHDTLAPCSDCTAEAERMALDFLRDHGTPR